MRNAKTGRYTRCRMRRGSSTGLELRKVWSAAARRDGSMGAESADTIAERKQRAMRKRQTSAELRASGTVASVLVGTQSWAKDLNHAEAEEMGIYPTWIKKQISVPATFRKSCSMAWAALSSAEFPQQRRLLRPSPPCSASRSNARSPRGVVSEGSSSALAAGRKVDPLNELKCWNAEGKSEAGFAIQRDRRVLETGISALFPWNSSRQDR